MLSLQTIALAFVSKMQKTVGNVCKPGSSSMAWLELRGSKKYKWQR